MDEPALRDRLDRIERRQRITIALLVVPYVLGVGELIGYWIVGALGVGLGVVAFVLLAASRRRSRDGTGG